MSPMGRNSELAVTVATTKRLRRGTDNFRLPWSGAAVAAAAALARAAAVTVVAGAAWPAGPGAREGVAAAVLTRAALVDRDAAAGDHTSAPGRHPEPRQPQAATLAVLDAVRAVLPVLAIVVAVRERPDHRLFQLVHEQGVHQPAVLEGHVRERQPHAEHGVVAQCAGPFERRPGGGQRVPHA